MTNQVTVKLEIDVLPGEQPSTTAEVEDYVRNVLLRSTIKPLGSRSHFIRVIDVQVDSAKVRRKDAKIRKASQTVRQAYTTAG